LRKMERRAVPAADDEIVETVLWIDGKFEYQLHDQKSFPWGGSGDSLPKWR
jgi:hypothetical protein